MIATCPACGKRYSLADDAVPAAGRSVSCAACGHSWTAVPDGAAASAMATAEEAPLASAAAATSAELADPARASATGVADPRPVEPIEPVGAPPPPRRRRRHIGWLAAVFALLAVAALAVIEFAPADTFDPPRLGLPSPRLPFADLGTLAVPKMPSLDLPSLDLPPLDLTRVPLFGDALDRLVNPPPAPTTGLRITASGERRRLANGTWLLTVTGTVANPTATPVALTAIDAALLDGHGHPAVRWRIAAPASVVEAHGSAAFESVTANFPAGATVLRLRPR